MLHSESNGKGEFNPRAYQVFGPKIVATRGDLRFLSPSEVSDLAAGDWYMNVTSSAFPSGELRGQIDPMPEPSGMALLAIGIGGWLVVRAKPLRRARCGVPALAPA